MSPLPWRVRRSRSWPGARLWCCWHKRAELVPAAPQGEPGQESTDSRARVVDSSVPTLLRAQPGNRESASAPAHPRHRPLRCPFPRRRGSTSSRATAGGGSCERRRERQSAPGEGPALRLLAEFSEASPPPGWITSVELSSGASLIGYGEEPNGACKLGRSAITFAASNRRRQRSRTPPALEVPDGNEDQSAREAAGARQFEISSKSGQRIRNRKRAAPELHPDNAASCAARRAVRSRGRVRWPGEQLHRDGKLVVVPVQVGEDSQGADLAEHVIAALVGRVGG